MIMKWNDTLMWGNGWEKARPGEKGWTVIVSAPHLQSTAYIRLCCSRQMGGRGHRVGAVSILYSARPLNQVRPRQAVDFHFFFNDVSVISLVCGHIGYSFLVWYKRREVIVFCGVEIRKGSWSKEQSSYSEAGVIWQWAPPSPAFLTELSSLTPTLSRILHDVITYCSTIWRKVCQMSDILYR